MHKPALLLSAAAALALAQVDLVVPQASAPATPSASNLFVQTTLPARPQAELVLPDPAAEYASLSAAFPFVGSTQTGAFTPVGYALAEPAATSQAQTSVAYVPAVAVATQEVPAQPSAIYLPAPAPPLDSQNVQPSPAAAPPASETLPDEQIRTSREAVYSGVLSLPLCLQRCISSGLAQGLSSRGCATEDLLCICADIDSIDRGYACAESTCYGESWKNAQQMFQNLCREFAAGPVAADRIPEEAQAVRERVELVGRQEGEGELASLSEGSYGSGGAAGGYVYPGYVAGESSASEASLGYPAYVNNSTRPGMAGNGTAYAGPIVEQMSAAESRVAAGWLVAIGAFAAIWM